MTEAGLTVERGAPEAGVVARLAGESDLANARDVEARLVAEAGAGRLVLDLSALGYLDSAGLAMIDRLARSLDAVGGSLRVVAREGSVAHGVLRIARLAGVPVASEIEAEEESTAR